MDGEKFFLLSIIPLKCPLKVWKCHIVQNSCPKKLFGAADSAGSILFGLCLKEWHFISFRALCKSTQPPFSPLVGLGPIAGRTSYCTSWWWSSEMPSVLKPRSVHIAGSMIGMPPWPWASSSVTDRCWTLAWESGLDRLVLKCEAWASHNCPNSSSLSRTKLNWTTLVCLAFGWALSPRHSTYRWSSELNPCPGTRCFRRKLCPRW